MENQSIPLTNSIHMKDSIGFRLLTTVFSIYFLVTLTVTITHMVIDYHIAKDEVAQNLQDLGKVFEPGFAVSLWNEDDEQIRSLMEGMLQIPFILGVKLESPDGELMGATGDILDQEGTTVHFEKGKKLVMNQPPEQSLFFHQYTAHYEKKKRRNYYIV